MGKLETESHEVNLSSDLSGITPPHYLSLTSTHVYLSSTIFTNLQATLLTKSTPFTALVYHTIEEQITGLLRQ